MMTPAAAAAPGVTGSEEGDGGGLLVRAQEGGRRVSMTLTSA